MSSSDKVGIFIDGGYVRAMLHEHYSNYRIDFLKLSNELCQGCERYRTYYYMCPPYQSKNPTDEERAKTAEMDKFFAQLRLKPRFVLRLGRLQRTGNPVHPFVQKGVDVLLSIDLTQISAEKIIDQAIVVSADSDFAPAIERARDNHILVTVAYFPEHYSRVLNSNCDERIEIDKNMVSRIGIS